MQFHQFVVYKQIISTIPNTTHQEINEKTVNLCKIIAILVEGWERFQMEKICPLIKEWKALNLGLGNASVIQDGTIVLQF